MTELRILGPAELRLPDGTLEHSFLAGPKRLGLLTYLVLRRPGGFHRRDSLLPLFWPERGQKDARNALSNMLYHMRRTLGPELIVNRGREEVGMAAEGIWCDALAFHRELEDGRPAAAVGLYRGELLEGFHLVDGDPAFDHWLGGERRRLRRVYLEALELLAANAAGEGEEMEAVRWWRRRFHEDRLDARVVEELMRSLRRAGRGVKVGEVMELHARALEEELGMEPAPELVELAGELAQVYRGGRAGRGPDEDASEEPGPARVPSSRSALDPLCVAVLPFEELGATDPGAFGDGLHSDLLTRLSTVEALTVISRTSVLRYRDGEAGIPQIARELGAGAVVEGGVQTAGGRVRLNVQLIDAQQDAHLWAETYDRELTAENLFQLQSDLAERIARGLEANLTPAEEERALRWTPTRDLEAYRLHAHGRQALDRRTEEGMREAAERFRQALARDADYGLAWVGLADALTLLHDYGYEAPDAVLPEAEEAVKRALVLNPELAEAHASKGLLHATRHQGPPAVRSLQRAVELQPSYAEAHNWLSWVTELLGRAGEALAHANRAVALDPLSAEAVVNLALGYVTTGQGEAAVREAERVEELSPGYTTGPLYQALALYDMERLDEARSVLDGLSAAWAGKGAEATLALVNVGLGDVAQARVALEGFRAEGCSFAAGLVHLSLGEVDAAFSAFDRVERWEHWPTLAVHHFYGRVWETVVDDPRYGALVRRVNRWWGLEPDGVFPPDPAE